MGAERYEVQRLDGRGEIVRRTTNLRWSSAVEIAIQESAKAA